MNPTTWKPVPIIFSLQANCETHDMTEHMILDAMFDYTRFDSLNKFGSARGSKEKTP